MPGDALGLVHARSLADARRLWGLAWGGENPKKVGQFFKSVFVPLVSQLLVLSFSLVG
jgi:hypothetical protein